MKLLPGASTRRSSVMRQLSANRVSSTNSTRRLTWCCHSPGWANFFISGIFHYPMEFSNGFL